MTTENDNMKVGIANNCRLIFIAPLVLFLAVIAVSADAQTSLPPLSVRVEACTREAKVVNWIYQQRNAGAERSVTDNAIQGLDISAVLGAEITSITDSASREGLRKVILRSVEQAYSHPPNTRTPAEGEALYFQGCAQGAAADDAGAQ
jgi:hypothetical protein